MTDACLEVADLLQESVYAQCVWCIRFYGWDGALGRAGSGQELCHGGGVLLQDLCPDIGVKTTDDQADHLIISQI